MKERTEACHWHYVDGFIESLDQPSALREAMARSHMYSKIPIYIDPGDVIVGNLDRAINDEPVLNRISAHYLQRNVVENIMQSNEISDESKQSFQRKLDTMKPYILRNILEEAYTEEENTVWESGTAASCHYNGHMVLDYDYLLQRGLPGILQDVQYYKNRPLTDEMRYFYEALEITVHGMNAFIQRHAALAQDLLDGMDAYSKYDRETLTKIRDNCLAIISGAPSSFFQALQLHWFVMGFADYDSFGRFDQYLYPYYLKSVTEEGLTREEGKEYLKHYWRKLEQNGAIMNMTIGGVKPDGTDGVNELTYLVLEVTRELKFKSPNLCLRITSGSPDRLWEEVHRNLAVGQALPALYNESRIIPMLEAVGIGPEDARDFGLAGCSQIVIPGKSSFACDIGVYNPLKCLELALHDGFDPRINKQAGPHTGIVQELDTYEKVVEAYRKQVKYAIRVGAEVNNKDHTLRKDFCSTVRSMLTDNCLKQGRGIFQGGAKYYAVQNEVIGLTNVANSLMSLKKVVFEDNELSLEELVQALDRNFEGHEDLRQRLINRVPKFGNDIDEVDEIRDWVTREFYEELSSYKGELGGLHWPGEVIFHYHVSQGKHASASADGRKAYQPLADSAGASQGTDLLGPTAIINSMLKLPLDHLNTCCSLNLRFTKSLWAQGKDKVISLFRSYFERGGFQLQINVLDREVLLDARKNPENHRSLVVRVGGYSAYFTYLAPEIQDEIIQRTEHSL